MIAPRLGFLGAGWIGRDRMQAIVRAGGARVVAIADPSSELRQAALAIAPGAIGCEHLEQLLEQPIDGVVIATPSELHAEQCLSVLARGFAVFCQKPLGLSAAEVALVISAARRADRLLGMDLSYRHTGAVQRIREALRDHAIGRVFALDLVFHNAHGPDTTSSHDPASDGNSCAVELGLHLIDLALWLLDFPRVEAVESTRYRDGVPLARRDDSADDHATVQLRLSNGVAVRIACSWRRAGARAALIEAACYGSEGELKMRNVDGSFYDFVAERSIGSARERFACALDDDWGGRAVVDWSRRLARGPGFDAEADRLVEVAAVLDAVCRGAGPGRLGRPVIAQKSW